MGLLDELAAELATLEELNSSPESSPEPSPEPSRESTPVAPRARARIAARSPDTDSPRARRDERRMRRERGGDAVASGKIDRSDALALELACAHERALCNERESHRHALDNLAASLRAEQQQAIVALARVLEHDFLLAVNTHRVAERAALAEARGRGAEAERLRAELRTALDARASTDARARAAEAVAEGAAARSVAVGEDGARWHRVGCALAELQQAAHACNETCDALVRRATAAEDAARVERLDARALADGLRAELHSIKDDRRALALDAAALRERAQAAETAHTRARETAAAQLGRMRDTHAAQLQQVEERVRSVVRDKDEQIRALKAELDALARGTAELLAS